LKTRVISTAQNPGSILKSANENPNLLKIIALKDGKQNQTHILLDESASNNYLLSEDSYKLFVTGVTEPVSVYTRSSDGYALDINLWGDCSEMIPLGVRTSTTGSINLQFEGVENFYKLFLLDTQTDAKIDLKETPIYSFEKTTPDLFLDGRFYLSINKTPNSDLFPIQDAISIFVNNNKLQIVGNDDIKEVQVVDMQGRTILIETNIGNSVYTNYLPNTGIYIVKVLTEQGITVKKVTTAK